MEQLLGLAEKGLGYTLFVISALVNIYLYRYAQSIQEKRVEDWKTALGLSNTLALANQKLQEASNVMIQGIDGGIKRLLDKNKLL